MRGAFLQKQNWATHLERSHQSELAPSKSASRIRRRSQAMERGRVNIALLGERRKRTALWGFHMLRGRHADRHGAEGRGRAPHAALFPRGWLIIRHAGVSIFLFTSSSSLLAKSLRLRCKRRRYAATSALSGKPLSPCVTVAMFLTSFSFLSPDVESRRCRIQL